MKRHPLVLAGLLGILAVVAAPSFTAPPLTYTPRSPSIDVPGPDLPNNVVAGAEHQLRMIFRVNRPVRVEGPGFMMVAVEAAAVEGIHFIVGHEFFPRGVYALIAALGAEELAAGRIVDDLHREMLVP